MLGARPSRPKAVTARARSRSLTVAGQWRILTAFPYIPRPLVRAAISGDQSKYSKAGPGKDAAVPHRVRPSRCRALPPLQKVKRNWNWM